MTGNIKLAGFEIRKIDHKEMMIGLALIALSFLMPVLFTVQNFQVREYMHLALEKQEKTDLIISEHIILPSQWNSTGEGKKVGYPMHA